ncbi:hypothetical protein T484DRAFT_1920007 [Baffinella frigidus]|nr:hypothetical protein T484DRAFT_1920007 [Cryptophyta sp. CCMP2293]
MCNPVLHQVSTATIPIWGAVIERARNAKPPPGGDSAQAKIAVLPPPELRERVLLALTLRFSDPRRTQWDLEDLVDEEDFDALAEASKARLLDLTARLAEQIALFTPLDLSFRPPESGDLRHKSGEASRARLLDLTARLAAIDPPHTLAVVANMFRGALSAAAEAAEGALSAAAEAAEGIPPLLLVTVDRYSS